MPSNGFTKTRHRRGLLTATASAAAMLLAATGLVLTTSGSAGAADRHEAPQHHRHIKHGTASMGVGIRMHEGRGHTDGTPPKTLTETVHGVDVSGHQGNVDWQGLANSGVRWAYTKATEGTDYQNEYFTQQYNGSYDAGMIRGAYHFATPNSSSGADQANYFVDHGGGWSGDGKTLPGALDIEYNPYGATCYGLSQSAMVGWIHDFTNTYKSRTGRDPVIYTTTDWWTQCTGNNGDFGGSNPLWVARYADSPGTLPGGWGFHTIWQYTSTGPTVGDHDLFNGAYDRLQALAKG